MHKLIIALTLLTACHDDWQRRADIELEEPVTCNYPKASLAEAPAPKPMDIALEETEPEVEHLTTRAEPSPLTTPEIDTAPPEATATPRAEDMPEPQSPDAPEGACIDLNQASLNELTRLPGVGPGRAERIIARRQKRPFKRGRDITRVKGIGPATYQKMKSMLCP